MSVPYSRMDTMMNAVHKLSVEIGPRGSASEAEHWAAEYVADRLRNTGYTVAIESFRSVTSFSWAYGTYFAVFVIAAFLLVVGITPVIPAVLALLALVAFGLESSGIETLTRILPQRPSQNVVGHIIPPAEASRHIVVTAHIDSARSALLWHPRIVGMFRQLLLLAILSMLVITILAITSIFVASFWLRLVALIADVYVTVILFLLLDREVRGQITHGANDNASGVGVLLGVAESFAVQPLAIDTDVWIVATGCEEAGTVGMMRFMQRHGKDLPKDSTVFVNIDNVGAGYVTYTTAEGILIPLSTDRDLTATADSFSQAHPECSIHGRGYHSLTTDAIIPLSQGRRAISIMAFDVRGHLPNWHWHTDTMDHIDPRTISIAHDLTEAMVRSIN